jgi:hypothetical protein
MEDNKKVDESPKKRRRRRRKTEVQLKLEKLKEILKKGTEVQKKAIDKIIAQYDDYTNLETLKAERDKLNARIEAVEAQNQQ